MCPPPQVTVTGHVIQPPPPPLQSRVSIIVSSLLYIPHLFHFAVPPSLSFRLPSLPFLPVHSSLYSHVHPSYPSLGSQPSPQPPFTVCYKPPFTIPLRITSLLSFPCSHPLHPRHYIRNSHPQFTFLPVTGGRPGLCTAMIEEEPW